MATTTQLCADRCELGRQALAHRVPDQSELPVPGDTADVRQPKEVEGLRCARLFTSPPT